MKKLYLVDVSAMFFRSFFALPPLTNDKGLPTNALYGFLNMSIKLLRDLKPDYIVYCFDTKEPSFRSEIYPEYKANRDEMPEALKPQVPYVKKLSLALGVPIIERPGFEADDLIGTLAVQAQREGLEAVIISGDKDFAQLVNSRVVMYDTMKDVRYTPEGVYAKWGVHPEQFIDYLALVGDSSDNVPGVKGIGPKGAQKLLSDFSTLDGIYQNIEKISAPALKKKLIEGQDLAYLSKQLVTIQTDVDLGLDLEKMKMGESPKEELRALLLELGFKTFAKNLTGATDEEVKASTPSKDKLQKTKISDLESKGSIDTESQLILATHSLNKQIQFKPQIFDHVELVPLSICEVERSLPNLSEIWVIEHQQNWYLSFKGKMIRISADDFLNWGQVLSQKRVRWCGFDLKKIWHLMEVQDPQIKWDSLLAAYVLRADSIKTFSEVFAQIEDSALPEDLSPEALLSAHWQVALKLIEKLNQTAGSGVYLELEQPLEPVVYQMESLGILINTNELKQQSETLSLDLKELEGHIFEFAGESFNIGSPKQLGQILFEKMKLPVGKKTKTGYSTDSDVLEGLKAHHPIAEFLIQYRELSKLKSTYVDALPELVNPKTNRLHTSFHQTVTTTGRLSSQNPNLQNIPIKTKRGRLVRKAFEPRSGSVLLSADYSQIELRILAHLTGDAALCNAFAQDLDIHSATASEIFNVPLNEVNSDLRRKAKAVNFGIAYGQTAYGLAETLGIPQKEAAEIIGKYFSRFSGVRTFMEDVVKSAKQKGFVETLFGRRRYIDEFQSSNGMIRKFGERAAINAPMQGTASDIVKLAMIEINRDSGLRVLLQVHDELLFEIPEDQVESQAPFIKGVMENVVQLKVPLKVNVASGKNWEDAHS